MSAHSPALSPPSPTLYCQAKMPARWISQILLPEILVRFSQCESLIERKETPPGSKHEVGVSFQLQQHGTPPSKVPALPTQASDQHPPHQATSPAPFSFLAHSIFLLFLQPPKIIVSKMVPVNPS